MFGLDDLSRDEFETLYNVIHSYTTFLEMRYF